MPTFTIEIDDATRRKLDEVAALVGEEPADRMVARLLPFWLGDHESFWRYVEEGRRAFRRGDFKSHEEVFAELRARYPSQGAPQAAE